MANTVTGFAYTPERRPQRNPDDFDPPFRLQGKKLHRRSASSPFRQVSLRVEPWERQYRDLAIDPKTGKLDHAGFEPTEGKNPRNFAIDPTGSYLLAENMDSSTIVVFHIDPRTGGSPRNWSGLEACRNRSASR